MIKVDQTKFGNKEGNCLAACLASILECSIEDVPEVNPSNWINECNDWIGQFGLALYWVEYTANLVPRGYAILSGDSPRGDFGHSVVAKDGEIVHDPHPDRSGIESKKDWLLFTTIDPTKRFNGKVDYMLSGHKCRPIARMGMATEDREWWLGELLEPYPQFPLETHCMHIKTPVKEVVLGVMHGDMSQLAVLCQIVHGKPINQTWLNSTERHLKKRAGFLRKAST